MTNKISWLAIIISISSTVMAADYSALIMPNTMLTPGMINPNATVELLCNSTGANPDKSSGTKVRKVSKATELQVYNKYQLIDHVGYCAQSPRGCEIDHLVSLELGGSNNSSNLWPQSYGGMWNAVQKDTLEDKLGKLVCKGTISLSDAQSAISTDWIQAYKKYIGVKK